MHRRNDELLALRRGAADKAFAQHEAAKKQQG